MKGGGSTEPHSLDSPLHEGVSSSQSPEQCPDSARSKLRKLEKHGVLMSGSLDNNHHVGESVEGGNTVPDGNDLSLASLDVPAAVDAGRVV